MPERGSVAEYLGALLNSERYGAQVVAHRTFTPTEPKFAPANPPLPKELEESLSAIGIEHLYSGSLITSLASSRCRYLPCPVGMSLS